MLREKRRCESTLMIAGNGILFFTIWNIIKMNLYFLVGKNYIRELLPELFFALSDSEEFAFMIAYIGMMIALFFNAIFQIYVGLSARAEAKGKKKTDLYIVVSCILWLSILPEVKRCLTQLPSNTIYIGDQVATALVDISLMIALTDLIYSAMKLRSIKKKLLLQDGQQTCK